MTYLNQPTFTQPSLHFRITFLISITVFIVFQKIAKCRWMKLFGVTFSSTKSSSPIMSIIKTNTIIILIIIDSNYYLVSVNRNSQQRCSVQKGVLKISQNSQGNTCARVSILITYFKKEALVQVLPCEFCEIFKNTSGRLLLLIKSNPLENLGKNHLVKR